MIKPFNDGNMVIAHSLNLIQRSQTDHTNSTSDQTENGLKCQ